MLGGGGGGGQPDASTAGGCNGSTAEVQYAVLTEGALVKRKASKKGMVVRITACGLESLTSRQGRMASGEETSLF